MQLPRQVRRLLVILAGVVLVAMVVGCNFLANDSAKVPSLDLPAGITDEFRILFEVYSSLNAHHIDRDNLDPTTLSRGAIRGMLAALDDPHAAYLTPELFNVEANRFKGAFEGIGAEVNLRDGKIMIVAPLPDTPAEKAGIRAGDVILRVNGESIEGLGLYEVVRKIRGPKGSSVILLVVHRNVPEPVEITIVRGTIDVDTVKLRILTGGIAHLKINTYGENTNKDLTEALDRVKKFKSKGLIIDLRNNPGGLVSSAVDTTSQFLESGLVFFQVDGQGRRKDMKVKPNGQGQKIPLVVLVNEFSASASEIMAGAIRDHGRGPVMGTKTYGKGSVSTQQSLSDGSGIYYSIARWYTPNGSLIEGEGIEPSIEVEADPEGKEDFQLDRAIEFLQNQASEAG